MGHILIGQRGAGRSGVEKSVLKCLKRASVCDVIRFASKQLTVISVLAKSL